MSKLQIVTNNVPRQMLSGYELTDSEKEDFDYIDDIDCADFVRFKGRLYDVNDFMVCRSPEHLPGWDGYHGDSYFSGVLIRLVDSDAVIMGTYYG